MHKNCFSFDGKIYKQISGVLMGSSLNFDETEFERLRE